MDDWKERLHFPKSVSDLCQQPFEEAFNTACNVLRPSLNERQTQSSCALLVGPASSGKSLLTRFIVDRLRAEFDSQNRKLLVITLSGLIHNTPLRTWAKLTSDVLSQWDPQQLHNPAPQKATAAANGDDEELQSENVKSIIQPVLDQLRNDSNNHAILIVIDEFHRFANSEPLSQTVLYSLLNLLQDRSLNSACIAQTSYVDVTDLLEKRVLSRLSHRKVVVPLVHTHESLLAFFRHALIPSFNTAAPVTPQKKKGRSRNRSSQGSTANRTPPADQLKWDTFIHTLLEDEGFLETIHHHLMKSRIITPIIHAVDSTLTILYEDCFSAELRQADRISDIVEQAISIINETMNVEEDTTIDTIISLTQIQLALLIALKRIETVLLKSNSASVSHLDGSEINLNSSKSKRVLFTDVYKEYCRLGKLDESRLSERDNCQNVVDQPNAARAWETLIDYGIVIRTGTGPRDSRPVYCAVASTQIDQAIDKYKNMPSVLKNWAKQKVTKS